VAGQGGEAEWVGSIFWLSLASTWWRLKPSSCFSALELVCRLTVVQWINFWFGVRNYKH
jgi:hypothetical protein